MTGIEVSPALIYAGVIAIIVAATSWGILTFKRRGDPDAPYDTVDKVLWGLTIPVLAVVVIGGFVMASQARKTGRLHKEGDDDLTPDEPETDPGESRGDQVARIIEDRAEEVEKHVLEEATEDEVAARGAGLFDPGKPTDVT